MPRVAVLTLGCAKNQADTDLLAGQMLREGIEITSDPAASDAIIVNTCAFLTSSQQESIDAILEMAEHKKKAPRRKLIVVGCLAQRHGASLLEGIPEVDLVVGPGEVHSLAPRIAGLLRAGGNGDDRVRLGGMDRVEERWDVRVVSAHPHSAYVKISEGCDRTCSFCIIPKLRGGHRSRSLASVVNEARTIAGSGVREICLVAQELTAYGTDTGDGPALEQLLRQLDTVAGLAWIRLLYTYPTNWSDGLIDAIRDLPRVCRYVDMPIQHVSESVLRSMRRPPFRRTRGLLESMRSRVPGVALRTTLITGYPGETDGDFQELLDFVRAFGFDHLGVFAYSREEGTHAADLPGHLPERVKEERRKTLLAAQKELSLERNKAWIGRRVRLLVDAFDRDRGWIARHEGQAPEVDGVTILGAPGGAPIQVGDFVEATVTFAGAYDLEARLEVEQEAS